MVAAVNSVRRNLSHVDFVVLSLYWVAIGYLWTSLGGLILPDMVIQLVGREHEGFALGVLEAVGSLMAVVWQPIAGALSDRTTTRFGRRRPYIVVGTVGDVLFLVGLALSGTFGLVLIFYFLLQAASNTAQGPYQGLMPDVVPEAQRGTASGYFGVANVVGLLAGHPRVGLHPRPRRPDRCPAQHLRAAHPRRCWPPSCLIPDRATRTASQFKSVREALTTTFARPLRYPAFLWLMASRLLILMGLVGVQSFVFFYFNNVFFHNDRMDTITASYTLLGPGDLRGASWSRGRRPALPTVSAGGRSS